LELIDNLNEAKTNRIRETDPLTLPDSTGNNTAGIQAAVSGGGSASHPKAQGGVF
jgi:hypothetical protein